MNEVFNLPKDRKLTTRVVMKESGLKSRGVFDTWFLRKESAAVGFGQRPAKATTA